MFRNVVAKSKEAGAALDEITSAAGSEAELVRALTTHTPIGVFLSDASGACRFVNDRWCALTGLSYAEALGSGWAAAVHSDDRERVASEWQTAAAEERDSVITYRFLRPDGSVAWIEGYASAFHDGQGRLIGWIGRCLDITAHRTAQLELEQERELFRVAFESAPTGVALISLDGRLLRVNEALCRMLGYRREELLGRATTEITHLDDLRGAAATARRLRAGTDTALSVEQRYVRKDGSVLWASLSVALIDDNGKPRHFVAHVEDIAERKRAELELRRLAEHDPLTELLNRRSFLQQLGWNLRQAPPPDGWTLLLVDVDGFKRVNDGFGHQAGDEALRAVGRVLQRRLRGSDLLARLGGDEFAALVSGSGSTVAQGVLEAVRNDCRLDSGEPLTVSIGVAKARPGVTPGELISSADRALYHAKRGGRDRYSGGGELRAIA